MTATTKIYLQTKFEINTAHYHRSFHQRNLHWLRTTQSAYYCKEIDNDPWSNLCRIKSLITSPIWSVTTLRDDLFWGSNYNDSSRHARQRTIIISKGNNGYSTMIHDDYIFLPWWLSPKIHLQRKQRTIIIPVSLMAVQICHHDDWAHMMIELICWSRDADLPPMNATNGFALQ